MATNFPTSIDSLTNPASTDSLDTPSHSTQHINSNDAIEAIQAKVGVDNSAVTTSHDYKISQLETDSHSPVTVTDSTEIDFTLTGQEITASLKSGSIDETKLDTSVNASLDLADSAVQPTSTDTLTNKTINADNNTISNLAIGSEVSATLGSDITGGDYDITGLGAVSFTQELDNGTKSANFTVDFATDQKQKVTLTANTLTLTLDTTSVGVGNYLLKIVNGGLATLTWASESGSIYWAGGTAPTLTSSGTDIVSAYFDGTNWYLQASLDFS
jgi:hypothetical protein